MGRAGIAGFRLFSRPTRPVRTAAQLGLLAALPRGDPTAGTGWMTK
jgi:hypothetical protein